MILNEKTDLVEYLRLIGVDYDFEKEYRERMRIDEKSKLIDMRNTRLEKLKIIIELC